MLLDFIECNIEGIKTIIVTTGSKNCPTVNFYEKKFSKIGEIKVYERLSLILTLKSNFEEQILVNVLNCSS